MTKKTQKDNTEHCCPLGDLTAAFEEASNFYRRREENDPTYRETTGWDDPQVLSCRKVINTACSDKLVNEVCVNGVCWRRASVPNHKWVDANASPPRHGGQRSHYHTTFDLDGHSVHVDYIKQSSSGPGSGVHDTQFFVDGQFVSRGGHAFTVPARIPRGEPAAMQWRGYLLVCENNIDHWSTPHPSWFTLWKQDKTQYSESRS
ncbi:hypothetical protein Q31b_50910 [Novipirellula aureliae]|uniref:Uncharacterized protein n=1 Tax=Novipirellula aureliae TaxID=2527966 RepID=A0A5C6DL67_9BACT|nr:hypothetical protein [Novipirellula aureliae]TWU35656.1 hypothetical protein Q31b_50910 [Novipirellula aureliae]